MTLEQFRGHFPVAKKWAFLDHAAVCPIPDLAVQAMNDYARLAAENGIAAIAEWVGRTEQARSLAARLINSPSAEDVAFVANTTTGIGMVAEGIRWQPGDNVVLAAEEYPSNQYPWLNLQENGVEVRAVPSRDNRVSVDDLRQAVDSRTRVVTTSFVQFSSGYRTDLAAVGDICKRHGCFFFVDAIQGLGALPIDVQSLPIDALAADGHKWLLGPEGAGIFYVRRESLDRLHPVGVGAHSVLRPHDYSQIDFRLKPHAGRYEGGSLNYAGILGLGESIRLLLEVGIETVSRQVFALTDRLCEQAASAGLELFSSQAEAERSGIVSLTTPGRDPMELMKRCRAEGVVVNCRANRLRVSPHAYNTDEEIDRFLEAVK